ncbi:MAG: hypothetical protein JST12_17420 [Armatimonadetes bacterium]|nr:hypothetical protein [Armatimonadota bacterium]
MRLKFGLLGGLVAALAIVGISGCNGGGNSAANSSSTTANSSDTNSTNTAEGNSANNPASNEASNNGPAVADSGTKKDGTKTPAPPPHTADIKSHKPPEKPVVDVQKMSGDQGAAGKTDAMNVATQLDSTMKSLRDSKMEFQMGAKLPSGTGFVNKLATVVADENNYLVRYANFPKNHGYFETYIVTKMKDGKYGTLIKDKYVEGRPQPNPDVLKGWVTDSIQYITMAIGTKDRPFTDLINAASKANWKINVEDRAADQGKFKRIVMESPNEPKRRYEVIYEPHMMLPAGFNADIYDPKKKTQVSLQITTLKSDRPLTKADLDPKVPTAKINVLTPDEAKKMGIQVPESKGGNDKNMPPTLGPKTSS